MVYLSRKKGICTAWQHYTIICDNKNMQMYYKVKECIILAIYYAIL